MGRFLALLLGLAVPGSAQAVTSLPYTSAMIDPTMFRDGEVQRTIATYGAWMLTCDTISRLQRSYCSLQSTPTRIGAAAVELIVSTGDDGRPAALLRLPFGLALASGVEILADANGRRLKRAVPIALCDLNGCVAVWAIDDGELETLRCGRPLRVTVRGWRPVHSLRDAPPPIVISISGSGFPDALRASVH